MVRKGWLVIAVLLSFVVGAVAGGVIAKGHAEPAESLFSTRTTTVTQSLLPANRTSCTAYVSGHEAMVIIFGGGSRACQEWISSRSNREVFWTGTPQQNAGEQTICTLSNGHEDIAVQDGGGAAIGTELCGALVREGWVETNLPTPG